MQSVHIVSKPGNRQAEALGREIGEWFSRHGVSAVWSPFDRGFFEALRVPGARPDIALAVGGDGTMLSACRAAAGSGVPVLGVNRGNLGFLAEVPAENWQPAMTQVLTGNFGISPRIVLTCRIMRKGREVPISRDEQNSDIALNEVCLARGSLARIMDFEISVNNEFLGTIRADGIIMSTPTGATGYSVSAGGPILLPEMDVFTVTPVCPFLSFFPPLVVFGDSKAHILVKNAGGGVLATLDGHNSIPLEKDDEVCISRWPERALIATLPGYSYFGVLRDKGFIRG